jgi:hypothetical protein
VYSQYGSDQPPGWQKAMGWVYYEDLLPDTQKEIRRIIQEINLDILIDPDIVNKPSKTDFFYEY